MDDDLACLLVVALVLWSIFSAIRAAISWWWRDDLAVRDNALRDALVDDPCAVDDGSSLLVGEEGKPRSLPAGRRERRSYANSVVAQVKITMGTPAYNAANVLVARRIARQAMEAHGVRPTHIAQILPLVVEAVFVESTHEHEARAWGHRVRARQAEWFGPRSGAEPQF
jgi:hypothetical protein